MKRNAETPKAYLADLGGVQLEIVKRIRRIVRSVMPEFVEEIRYGMLDYPGLANLAAQKRYVALYVAPAVLARHRRSFPGVDGGKSCLRFVKLEQADSEALNSLLEEVLAYRLESESESG